MTPTPIESIEVQVEDAAVKAGGLLRSRYGLWLLGGVSFFESALPVPLITDPFLVAYILAAKHRAIVGFLVTTIASLVGGAFAYIVAYAFYDVVVAQYLTGPVGEQFFAITEELQSGTFVFTILGAVTPVPYTLVAMAAGFIKGNFLVFMLGSFVGRASRYAVVAWLTYRFGDQALDIARRHFFKVTIVCFVLAAIYFYLHF